jgi:phytanoyl-CoA hydroxylase
MVADAIGPDVKFVHSKINLKMPGADTVVGYHQDFAFVPHTNEDMLTALLMLHDTDAGNGGLEVVPGSHREGLESLWQDGAFSGTVSAETRAACERRAVPIAGPAGAVCLMAGHVLHASRANDSNRPRRLYITVYSAADAFMLWGNSLPNRLEGEIVRGVPSRHARLTPGLIEVRESYGRSSFFQIPGQGSGIEDT